MVGIFEIITKWRIAVVEVVILEAFKFAYLGA